MFWDLASYLNLHFEHGGHRVCGGHRKYGSGRRRVLYIYAYVKHIYARWWPLYTRPARFVFVFFSFLDDVVQGLKFPI